MIKTDVPVPRFLSHTPLRCLPTDWLTRCRQRDGGRNSLGCEIRPFGKLYESDSYTDELRPCGIAVVLWESDIFTDDLGLCGIAVMLLPSS